MDWTEQQISELKELVLGKYTFTEIGKYLGKTKNSIAGKCHRLGLVSLSEVRLKPKQPGILLKSDKMVLAEIKKYTDKYGWGLEISEIIEYTKLSLRVAVQSVKRLIRDGYINKTVSHVADHIFYNNALVKQIEYS